MKNDIIGAKKRPTSPHLTLYKPMITSVSSILGRFAGIYVYLITVLISIFIAIEIQNNKDVGNVLSKFLLFMEQGTAQSFVLMAFSFVSIFIFFLYILALIRHLMWDFGYCLNLKIAKILGYGMFVVAFLISLFLNFYMFF
jgi:succinate dehydrogenase / fumarate reductase cytochrome b subunit